MGHDLIGKPVSTFPDHALAPLLGVGLKLRFEGRKLGERRIRIGRLFALAPLILTLILTLILPLAGVPLATMPFATLTTTVAGMAAFARLGVFSCFRSRRRSRRVGGGNGRRCSTFATLRLQRCSIPAR
ncbi:MAG: hypothetical protein WCD52_12785, partial [Xanthobacteraceae bacterium]